MKTGKNIILSTCLNKPRELDVKSFQNFLAELHKRQPQLFDLIKFLKPNAEITLVHGTAWVKLITFVNQKFCEIR